MTSTNKNYYNKVFTKVSGDSTSPFRPGTEKPMFHKEQNKKTIKNTIGEKYHPARRRENIHISDGKTPNYIKNRIQVNYNTVLPR